MSAHESRTVAVVGGGLAGLAAAITAADAGAAVTLFDARDELGGRARTRQSSGFSFNQGPHALYRAGAAMATFRKLGIAVDGRAPALAGAELAVGGGLRRSARPSTLGTGGLHVMRAVLAPGAIDRAAGRSMAEWIDTELPAGTARIAGAAFTRLTSYAADLDRIDAAAHLRQIRRAARGVLYLHEGWSTLVASLTGAAVSRGVTIDRAEKVTAVSAEGSRHVVTTATATTAFDAVVLAAGGPEQCAGLLDAASAQLERWAGSAHPATVSCLDVALSRLPNRRHTSVIGLDEPTYFIVHSEAARLAPDGGALIHVLRYRDDVSDAAALRASLEAQLDRAQPGWRDVLVEAHLGRRLVAASDVARVGVADRPDVTLADHPGVFVAGDWITIDGLLADAAVGSGARAGHAAASAAASAPADRPSPLGVTHG